MSEPRGGYTDTYVESVEWQRDKAYARAYAAEARAEKLAAALREIAHGHYPCNAADGCGGSTIAARALADGEKP